METGSASTKGQNEQLIIILHIEEGVGLNAAEAILMQATLSGNKMEGEPIKPGHTTLFDCNLIWETDRKSIKRMKTENLPVKIDCHALKNFKGNVSEATREHVGYILCPVKNIPIVSLQKALQIQPRWTKLIGLSKDWRPHKPELLMNIMITSSDYMSADRSQLLESHIVESSDSIVTVENPILSMLESQKGIFIRLLKEEGLLQVGSIDTNCDIFMVKIVMKSIRYLENLKFQDNQPRHDSNRDFYINYGLLGNQHTRELDKKFNRIYQIHEKVSINFRSSLLALQEYFEKVFFIPFEVMTGNKAIGSAEIRLNQLIKASTLKEFFEMYPSSICELNEICSLKTSHELQPNSSRPILECRMMIQYVATKKLHQNECLDTYKRQQEVDSQGGGDHEDKTKSPTHEKRKTLSDIPEVRSESDTSQQVKAVGVAKATEPKSKLKMGNSSGKIAVAQSDRADINSNQSGTSLGLPRLFSYNLQIKSVEFDRKPDKGIWQFSFFHDKADTPRTFINKEINEADIAKNHAISFEDFELKLFFTSHVNNITELIKSSEMCTLDIRGPRGKHGKAQLDCNSLLIGNQEKANGMVLLQDPSEQVTVMAKISANLEDLGINFNAQLKTTPHQVMQSSSDLHRCEMNVTRTMDEQKIMMHDENLSYKMIEELDEWKARQQEVFIGDLKKKESQLLERLKSSWHDKQAKYEQELVMKADQLTNLTKSLQDAQKNLKSKDMQHQRDDQEILAIKQELEKSYNNQVMAIRERARRMEDDLLHEMKLKDIRFDDIERCNEHLKTENYELLQQTECLRSELMKLKTNLIPKEEAEQLLQELRLLKEKYEATQQSKLFYKENWAKAMRECHKIRRENNVYAQQDIYTAKCDRLCDVLSDNHFDLDIDKQELDEIKLCLRLSDDDL